MCCGTNALPELQGSCKGPVTEAFILKNLVSRVVQKLFHHYVSGEVRSFSSHQKLKAAFLESYMLAKHGLGDSGIVVKSGVRKLLMTSSLQSHPTKSIQNWSVFFCPSTYSYSTQTISYTVLHLNIQVIASQISEVVATIKKCIKNGFNPPPRVLAQTQKHVPLYSIGVTVFYRTFTPR